MIQQYTDDYRDAYRTLLSGFFVESLGDYGFGYSPVEVDRVIDDMTSFVVIKDGKLVGAMGGKVFDYLGQRIYQEVVWYVDPSCRSEGVRLMRYVESWCEQEGIDRIVMACMHNSKTDKLDSFYRRLGYVPMETHYIKEVG